MSYWRYCPETMENVTGPGAPAGEVHCTSEFETNRVCATCTVPNVHLTWWVKALPVTVTAVPPATELAAGATPRIATLPAPSRMSTCTCSFVRVVSVPTSRRHVPVPCVSWLSTLSQETRADEIHRASVRISRLARE